MTFAERNNHIAEMLGKFSELHSRFTSSTKILSDDEWSEYIHSMDEVCGEYKSTNMADISWKLCQAFLDDTEIAQKKLKGIK
jgi:hypothetical protein